MTFIFTSERSERVKIRAKNAMNAMQKTIEYALLIHYKLYDKNPRRLNKAWYGLNVI